MKNTLIIYSTTDGQTKRICDRIIEFSKRKSEITLCEIENAPQIDLTQYRKIVIGASIRYGKHNPLVYEFVKVNRDELEKKSTAFFTRVRPIQARRMSLLTGLKLSSLPKRFLNDKSRRGRLPSPDQYYFILMRRGFFSSGTTLSNSMESMPSLRAPSLTTISSAIVNFRVKFLEAIPR